MHFLQKYFTFRVAVFRLAALLLLFGAANQLCAQQSSCTNADLELGNFNGWTGQSTTIGNVTPEGILNGVHTIMTGDEMDPNTCDMVPVVAPGGVFSARLGNSMTGGHTEKLRYTMAVTPATSLFIYKYAVVLEDPGHVPEQQPRFDVQVLDNQGGPIDPVCGSYTVVAGSDLEGFVSCGIVRYRNWTTVGLNLTDYIGQDISIEFMTADCTVGGHYGYAYIDAYCSSLQISTAYCVGSTGTQLTAPVGFDYLWSTGETTQSILIPNAQQGDVYNCVLTSVTGCQVTVYATISLDDPIADFTLESSCYDNAVFKDTSQTSGSNFTDFLWDFGDGQQSNQPDPVHIFPSPGNYTVTLTISNSLGCSRSVTKTITVYLAPYVEISYAATYCTLTTIPQMPTLTGTGNYTGGVFSSTAGLSVNPATGAINPSLSQPGLYQVTYTLTDLNGCSIPPVTAPVKVVRSPTAQIHYQNAVFCQAALTAPQLVTLTGTGVYTNGVFAATPAGLSMAGNGTIDVNGSTPGHYTVTYTISSQNECPDFSTSTAITILSSALPVANLANGLICVDHSGQILTAHTFVTGLDNALYDFEWFHDNQLIAGAVGSSYTAALPGNYSVVITNAQTTCTSAPINAVVNVVAVADDALISIEEEFRDTNVMIHVINGQGAYLYQLDGGPMQYSNVFADVAPGMHTIKVTDPAHCTNITKDFFVLGYPKYFTPNSDGTNDYWRIDSGNLIVGTISIYDRYGKLLHVMKESDRGWDGTYSGNRMPATDYWFVVKYRYRNSGEGQKEFRAHFSLKR